VMEVCDLEPEQHCENTLHCQSSKCFGATECAVAKWSGNQKNRNEKATLVSCMPTLPLPAPLLLTGQH
jgi:hypothetical protein